MRIPTRLFIAFAAITCLVSLESDTNGQEIRKALRDYKFDRVFNYQADDPTNRSKMFNIHTGHYGKFYNCDGQEDKRHSPYICWKPHHDKDFPTWMGWRARISSDIAEMKQRVIDGAGDCQVGCRCRSCRAKAPRVNNCTCAECALANSSGHISQKVAQNHATKAAASERGLAPLISSKRTWSEPAAEAEAAPVAQPKHGLVAGKILNVRVNDHRPAVVTHHTQQSHHAARTASRGTHGKSNHSAARNMVDFWNILKR